MCDAVFIAVLGVLMCGFLVGGLIYELKTGTLVGRGWKVYAHRQDNPMLYWSSITIEVIFALIFVGIWLFAALGSKDQSGF